MIFPQFGAVCGDGFTQFAVFAPYAKRVTVRLFASDVSEAPAFEAEMKSVGRGCFAVRVAKSCHGMYYTYLVDGRETIDPYARSAGANSRRGLVFEEGSADPEGWADDSFEAKSPIVWEVHIRDFSSDGSLHIADAGKYSAFRSGVTLDGEPVLADYIKRLGVTYVQLLPTLDFGSVDELGDDYNWGYDPMCYFLPEGSYSSDPHDGFCRVRELKELVQTLHKAGIGVILDVVYNHTYHKEGGALDICAPDYYYRMKDGKPCNGSGCGNETRSESAMFSKLMIDSVTYLAKEYHIDGFRFDLMGLYDVDTMNRIRRALDGLYPDGRGKNILMYGEPWYCSPPYGVKGADKRNLPLLDARIGVFNDVTRDGLRGCHFGKAARGFVQGREECLDDVLSGICGGKVGKNALGINPSRQVIYAACHDNYTLFDQLSLTVGEGEDKERMQRMTGFLIMSALGIPFLQAGEEFMRTKGGDGNSYKSGDAVNKLDWKLMIKNLDCVRYYRGLIALRKSNRVFDDLRAAADAFELLARESGGAIWRVGDIIYGVNVSSCPLSLPIFGSADIYADIDRAGTEPFATCEGEISVAPRGVIAAKLR